MLGGPTRSASDENISNREDPGTSTESRPLFKYRRRTSSVPGLDELDDSAELCSERTSGFSPMRGISVQKARTRGYLVNNTGSALLLGSEELNSCLPERNISILIVTWNMNGKDAPDCLDELVLPESSGHVADLVVVGTQESQNDHRALHVRLQATLGPSHLLLYAASLSCLQLCVFVRRPLVWHCSVVEHDCYCIRQPVQVRTKGCVAVGFQVFGTSLLFLTCHLTAHLEREHQRIVDARRICASVNLPRILPRRTKSGDVTDRYDNVFWFGDLNFRLAQTTRPQVIDLLVRSASEAVRDPHPLSAECVSRLMTYDQLTEAKRRGRVFYGFSEGAITFAPTYKYDPGTDDFDTSSKQRVPAYTDRILFKSRRGCVRCVQYGSVPLYTTSDHKPVWGLYQCRIRPSLRSVPLCAGRFDRSVLLDGLQMRARSVHAGRTVFRSDRSTCLMQ